MKSSPSDDVRGCFLNRKRAAFQPPYEAACNSLWRFVEVGVNVPILQIMYHIRCLDFEAPGFLPAVQAGDKAALQGE